MGRPGREPAAVACLALLGGMLFVASALAEVASDPHAIRDGNALAESDSEVELDWVPPAGHDPLVRCTVLPALRRTDRFLRRRREGLPYADDPRTFTPPSEKVRLVIDAQALGYLNLYRLTHRPAFRAEATRRLDYVLGLGDSALRHSGFDGLLGYSFLVAYELCGERRYRTAGLRIADGCLTYADNIMNWGYMAAMNFGMAWQLTGRREYLVAARSVTDRTGKTQFPGGAFPHRSSRRYGAHTGYTAWLLLEMILHRRSDPDDPDMDVNLLKGIPFLENRVNPDGSLNYGDAAGTYYSDPGGLEPRGWTHDLASIAFVLMAAGRRDAAGRAVHFLLQQEMSGEDLGGYPDKFAFPDSTSPLAMGAPSVARTSLIFWYLTEIAGIRGGRWNGTSVACALTPGNCNAAFRKVGLCDQGLAGHNACIDGQWTGCVDEASVTYGDVVCHDTTACYYNAERDESVLVRCSNPGTTKCILGRCDRDCVSPDRPECEDVSAQGDACGDAGAVAALGDPARTPPARIAAVSVRIGRLSGRMLSLVVTSQTPGAARFELFGVDGRRIAGRELGWLAAGSHAIEADAGRELAPGVYFVRVSVSGLPAIGRTAIVR